MSAPEVTAGPAAHPRASSDRIGPDDPRYPDLVAKRFPRLQRVKARWDPGNVFHHALSIRAD